MKTKEKLSFVFKMCIVIMAFVGLVMNYNIMGVKNLFLYFTTLSNLGCFLFFIYDAYCVFEKKSKGKNHTIIKGLITICITLTMIIFKIIVSKTMAIYSENILSSIISHAVVPIMVLLDYVIFSEKGKLEFIYPIIWSIYIVVYTIFCWIYSLLGGLFMNGDKYPYDYMNFEKYGIVKVLIVCIVIYVLFILMGEFVVYIDKSIARRKEMKTNGR